VAAAEGLLPRFVRLVAEFEELFKSAAPDDQQIDGNLRIKSPTTVTTEFLGNAYAALGAIIALLALCGALSVDSLGRHLDFPFAIVSRKFTILSYGTKNTCKAPPCQITLSSSHLDEAMSREATPSNFIVHGW